MFGLRDTVALVTGAGRGTARAHCERFADVGADLIMLDHVDAADDLEDTAQLVRDRGRRAVTGLADVDSLADFTTAVDDGVAELGRLDVIVALTVRNLLPVPWVEPVDVANASLFLASDEARFITSVSLPVDAGSTSARHSGYRKACDDSSRQ
ncbi:hypothetical protein MycrhDRAFT_3820 [Mycolicibacterium rhodesiae JS60]|nr:hypothetical protein MycrhDRAFT_3820 [Mycolicibacterium rhodesiae JS60]